MKNHKGNNNFNNPSKNQQNNGSVQPKKENGFNKPEKHTEPGKGGMQQPGMNNQKGYKQEEDKEKNNGKSKYFNYKKTCDSCNSSNCRCK